MSPAFPYERAELRFVVQDPEAMYLPEARRLLWERLAEVVRVESPIHLDEACRRVAACWGAARLTERVKRQLGETIALLGTSGEVFTRGDFLWRLNHTPSVSMEFRGADITGTWRQPEHIADEEIAAGAAWALARSLSMDEAELVRETARVFGVGRLGRKVEDRMAAGVAVLVGAGKARREGSRLVWVG